MNMKAKVIKCECGASFGGIQQASIIKMMEHCVKEHPEGPGPQREEDPEYDLKMCLLESKWKLMRAALDKDENHKNAIMQLPKLRTPYFLQDSSSSHNSVSSMVVVRSPTAVSPSNSVQETTQNSTPETPVTPQTRPIEKTIMPPLPSTPPKPSEFVDSKPHVKELIKSHLLKEPKKTHKTLHVSNQVQPVQCSSSKSSDVEKSSTIEIATKNTKKNKPSCTNNVVKKISKENEQLDTTQSREEIWDRIDEITGKNARKKKIKLKAPERDPELERICSKIPLKQNKAQSARRKSQETKKSESTSETSDVGESSESECKSSKLSTNTIHNSPLLMEHIIKQPTVRIKRLSLPYNPPSVKIEPASPNAHTLSQQMLPVSPKRNKKSTKKFPTISKKLKKCHPAKKTKAAIRSSGFDLDASPPSSPATKSKDLLNFTMPTPIFNADDFCNFDDDLPDL